LKLKGLLLLKLQEITNNKSSKIVLAGDRGLVFQHTQNQEIY